MRVVRIVMAENSTTTTTRLPPTTKGPTGVAEYRPLDWSERLLYLSIVLAILMVSALFVYCLCRITSNDDAQKDGKRRATNKALKIEDADNNGDHLMATATCLIPIRQSYTDNKQKQQLDVSVDVSQELQAEKRFDCVACRDERKQITWSRAQTTLNIFSSKHVRKELISSPT